MENSKKIFFGALFVLLVFVSTKINFSALVGAQNQFFTLFQFFGPMAGGILGPFVGASIVALASVVNFIVSGTAPEALNILRLAPMIVAAFYFGSKLKQFTLIAPIVAIIAFVAHPVGREVWFFSLFWTIPIIAKFFHSRLFLRSLGATFTAHSVGGAIWIWTVPMTPEAWIALIPVVMVERLLFASGISVSYVAANTLLSKVNLSIPWVQVDKKYIMSKKILRHF